jgi:tetratricopeptide (TPR) repeat protein
MIVRHIRILPLFFALLAGAPTAESQPADPRIAQAEQLYRDNNFQAAAEIYENLIRQGWAGGEIYYNLGNAYYKQGELGKAILNYERARRYLGKDPDLELNLKIANLRVPDRIEPIPRLFIIKLFQAAADLFTVRTWGMLLGAAEWVLLGCLAGLLFLRRPALRRFLSSLFFFTAVLALFCAVFFVSGYWSAAKTSEGIVLVGAVEVRSAPEEASTELFTLHEGVKFRVLRQVAGWAEIHLADGKRGWMPAAAFEMI